MATIINQQPLYNTFPVGQDVIFTVSNANLVSSELQVKFIADVYITSEEQPVMVGPSDKRGTFKTTPNNAGVGMFDFRAIIESYVKADNLAAEGSAYKETATTQDSTHPLHLIDNYSTSNNIIRYFSVKFSVQYLGAGSDPNVVTTAAGSFETSDVYKIFNGYLKYNDVLRLDGVDFGYNMSAFNLNGSDKKFLTNASTTQYANVNDYGTIGIWMYNKPYIDPNNLTGFRHLMFRYYASSGAQLDFEAMTLTPSNGGFEYANSSLIKNNIIYAGIYPGNLQGWSTKFQTLVAAGTISHYTVRAEYTTAVLNVPLSQTYTINVKCPSLYNYEPIRLGWLNQWGAWDYYTFTQKSIRTISTKGSTYNQLEGSWNESAYRLNSYKGGKKAFRVNATEKIKMNTDFVTEAEGEWFEDLMNSPEVYILKGYQDLDETEYALNQYVTPVRITSKSFTRKTIANDRLMQYTFEIEKSKILRTQSI
tara:strand:+ start:917 stop:2350 length:1434 start_codon:yes stop_codon:yes gene_type:complete